MSRAPCPTNHRHVTITVRAVEDRQRPDGPGVTRALVERGTCRTRGASLERATALRHAGTWCGRVYVLLRPRRSQGTPPVIFAAEVTGREIREMAIAHLDVDEVLRYLGATWSGHEDVPAGRHLGFTAEMFRALLRAEAAASTAASAGEPGITKHEPEVLRAAIAKVGAILGRGS